MRTRPPTHPGGILKRHYLEPLSLTVSELENHLEFQEKHYPGLLTNMVQLPQIWRRAYQRHSAQHLSCG
jgi:plasmid maintenance system antidote protein VapI